MFKTNITVRGYELDSFRHLNNAAYLNYLELARWEILKKTGYFDHFIETGLLLAVIDVHIRYMREFVVFDELIIETHIKWDAPYLVFRHILVNKGTNRKHARATVKTLLLTRDRLITDFPEGFFDRLKSAESE